MSIQEVKLDRTEEFLRAVVFRPSTQRLNVSMDSLSVGLVDDRYGHHIKVLAARLQVRKTLITSTLPYLHIRYLLPTFPSIKQGVSLAATSCWC